MHKKSIITFLAASLAYAGSALAADFYASTAGSPAGDGSIGNPWDLATALHHPPAVNPGDTIWVRGGTYAGAHTSLLAGSEGQPITVRAYRRERVVLDYASNGNCDPNEPDECSPNNQRCNALSVPACSHDVIFRDLEITNSAASDRISMPAGGCTEAPECCYVDGIAPPLKPECSETPAGIARAQWQPLYVGGDRIKIVNVAIHDGGTGIVADQNAIDTEIYGALVFNNGWVDPASGQGHGLQIENRSPSWRPSTKQVRNSVVWNNFGDGYRSFTTWGKFSSNLLLEDLVGFNNGAPAAAFYATDPVAYAGLQGSRYGNVLLQADELLRFIQLTRCRLYQPAGSQVHRQHFGGVKDADYEFSKDIIVENSYIATSGTPMSLIRWDRARMTGTTLVGGATPAIGDTELLVEFEKTDCASLLVPGSDWNPLDWDDNAYFFTGSGTTPFAGNTGAGWGYVDFGGWRTGIYNRDGNSTYATGLPPTNAIFVQANEFENGRAHVAVYNWQGLDSVSVDLTGIGLSDGDQFRIYNLQAFQNSGDADYFGTVVGGGTFYGAAPVFAVDMTDTSVTAPVGLGPAVASTLPEFGAFLVRKLPCGDAYLDAGEACDDGNATEGDGCDSNCTVSACGNGVTSGSEECDDGNLDDNDACKADCTLNVCGDGVIETGVEDCDDGNLIDGDGCDSNCTATACGNGVVTSGEDCDDGDFDDGDGCDSNCTVTACGNGILTSGEDCDDSNLTDGDGCDSNCTATACGNGVATAGEACDDGNAVDGDGCDSNCTATACGNGITTAGEACDDGGFVDGDGCDSNCTVTACGNGVTTAGEVCDDGNATEGDGCDSNCTPTACGNGVVSPSETCDDGNLVNGDGCDATCKPTGCGSGVRTGSEACDDGNLVAGDGCEANCTITPISESVGAGGRVTTDSGATGATEMVPLQSSVTTPTGGTVQISTTTDIETEKGFEILGIPVEINAPDATAANPLVIEIEVDASLIPEGVTLDRLHVLRDGKAVDDCTGAPGVAEPDPCMALRETQPDGDAMLTVLTSEASQWAAAIAGQSKDDQKCVLSLAKAALKVAKTQLKEGEKCVKFGAKGKEPDPQTCLTADAKGKIAKAVSKVEATATKKCSATPPFGIAGTAAVSAAAQAEELGLIADLFGSDLNVAVISSDDRDGSKCQSKVLKDAQKHLDTQVRLFERCAKDGLKGKPELMLTAADLEVCFAVVAADEKSKVAKSLAKIAKTLTKCPADLVPVLPAGCGAAGDVAACIAEQASCRFCRLMNAIHDVDVDCDTYDDGESDGSCS